MSLQLDAATLQHSNSMKAIVLLLALLASTVATASAQSSATESDAAARKTILFVVTSASEIGPHQRKTGYYFPEIAHPYHEFAAAGYIVDFASLSGGAPPADGYDPKDSLSKRFFESTAFLRLNNSRKLSEVDIRAYDAIFFPGGLGPMVDIARDPLVKSIIRDTYEQGRVVGAVCHGPVALLDVKLSNGKYLLKGLTVAAFTQEEEQGYAAADVPFMLETALKQQGALIQKAQPWQSKSVIDGRVVTGQNPASAAAVAQDMISLLQKPNQASK